MFEKFIEGRNRSIAWHYLQTKGRENILKYPQMCCYSFDHISQYINMDGRYEKEELDFISTALAGSISNRTVLDIGANIGNHTAFFAQTAAKVFSFEPHPKTFQLLKINTEAYSNVTVYNVGASDATKKLVAVSPLLNMGGTSIVENSQQDKEISRFERKTVFNLTAVDEISELVAEDIGFIKIDVEGHELQALHGIQKIINSKKPVIMLEQLEKEIDQGGSPAIDFLKSNGYAYFYEVFKPASWRTPDSLPGYLRMPLKLMEQIFLGELDGRMKMQRVMRLEKKSYFVLIASPDELPAAALN